MEKVLLSIQEAINLLPDAVLVVDEKGRIVTINDLALTLFGYSPKELKGKNLNILIPERLRARHSRHVKDYFKNPTLRKMGEAMKLAGVRKNGEEIDVDIALAPVIINNQNLVIASVRDISELKELERSLLHRNEQLSVINTELERFGYIIAHDLKSPLLNLHAIVSLLKRELPEAKSHNLQLYMDALDQTLRAMMNLISGVADYSKAGIAERIEEEVNLNEIIAEVRSLVQLPPNISLNVDQKLPVISGNKTKVLQVFLNLINNAVKYNDKPQGKIVVRCRKTKTDYIISVADNGPGVPPLMRRQIFGLFKKGHIQKEGSQGIGLAVVKKIITDRGGSIIVKNSRMGGAEFVISWPINQEPVKLEEHKAAQLVEQRQEAA